MQAVKTVGKYIILLLTVFFALKTVCDSPVLEMVSTDGQHIKQAAVGVPFIVQLVDTGGSNVLGKLTIPGLDVFIDMGSSLSMRTVGGQAVTTYKYIVRADRVGDSIVGPVLLNGIDSNVLEIKVKKEFLLDDGQKKSKKEVTPFAELSIEQDKLFVGEKTELTLRFYFPLDGPVNIQGIDQPENLQKMGLVFSKIKQARSAQTVDGKRYLFMQWSWDIYPKNAGSFVIPAFSVDYAVKRNMNGFFVNLIGFFNKKRTYSNSVTLDIKPLPIGEEQSNVVGHFNAFRAHVEPKQAKQGTAMVLTLEIEGDGNFDLIEAPALKDIPDALRSYGSQVYADKKDDATTVNKKRFEYILHGLQAGAFIIPSQNFTYFDSVTRRYVTLHTQPLHVTITPDPSFAATTHEDSVDEVDEQVVEQSIRPIRKVKTTGWNDKSECSIPWKLFVVLFLLPIVFLLSYSFLLFMSNRYGNIWTNKIGERMACARAKKRLRSAELQDEYRNVYGIFKHFFAARMGIKLEHITSKKIGECLKKILPDDELKEWYTFFDRVLQERFAKVHHEGQVDDFFAQARHWLTLLSKRI